MKSAPIQRTTALIALTTVSIASLSAPLTAMAGPAKPKAKAARPAPPFASATLANVVFDRSGDLRKSHDFDRYSINQSGAISGREALQIAGMPPDYSAFVASIAQMAKLNPEIAAGLCPATPVSQSSPLTHENGEYKDSDLYPTLSPLDSARLTGFALAQTPAAVGCKTIADLYADRVRRSEDRALAVLAMNRILDHESVKLKIEPQVSDARVDYILRNILITFAAQKGLLKSHLEPKKVWVQDPAPIPFVPKTCHREQEMREIVACDGTSKMEPVYSRVIDEDTRIIPTGTLFKFFRESVQAQINWINSGNSYEKCTLNTAYPIVQNEAALGFEVEDWTDKSGGQETDLILVHRHGDVGWPESQKLELLPLPGTVSDDGDHGRLCDMRKEGGEEGVAFKHIVSGVGVLMRAMQVEDIKILHDVFTQDELIQIARSKTGMTSEDLDRLRKAYPDQKELKRVIALLESDKVRAWYASQFPDTVDGFRDEIKEIMQQTYRGHVRSEIWKRLVALSHPDASTAALTLVTDKHFKQLYEGMKYQWAINQLEAEYAIVSASGKAADAFIKRLAERIDEIAAPRKAELVAPVAIVRDPVAFAAWQDLLYKIRGEIFEAAYSQTGLEFYGSVNSGELVVTRDPYLKQRSVKEVEDDLDDPTASFEQRSEVAAFDRSFALDSEEQLVPHREADNESKILVVRRLREVHPTYVPITDDKVAKEVNAAVYGRVTGKVWRETAYQLFRKNPIQFFANGKNNTRNFCDGTSEWPCSKADVPSQGPRALAEALFPETLFPDQKLPTLKQVGVMVGGSTVPRDAQGPYEPRISSTLGYDPYFDRVMTFNLGPLERVFTLPNN